MSLLLHPQMDATIRPLQEGTATPPGLSVRTQREKILIDNAQMATRRSDFHRHAVAQSALCDGGTQITRRGVRQSFAGAPDLIFDAIDYTFRQLNVSLNRESRTVLGDDVSQTFVTEREGF
jgi:hypothetical protein